MKQQFSVGDKAVYPVHGVAEVVALEQRDIGGATTSVYILKIIDTGMKIRNADPQKRGSLMNSPPPARNIAAKNHQNRGTAKRATACPYTVFQ